MKRKSIVFISLLLTLVLSQSVFAITLQEAKAEGFVGEQSDGYVGFVSNSISSEIRALVQDINDQRREQYSQIARQNNISVEQVRALAFERAVQATQRGHYIQDASGSWVKK